MLLCCLRCCRREWVGKRRGFSVLALELNARGPPRPTGSASVFRPASDRRGGFEARRHQAAFDGGTPPHGARATATSPEKESGVAGLAATEWELPAVPNQAPAKDDASKLILPAVPPGVKGDDGAEKVGPAEARRSLPGARLQKNRCPPAPQPPPFTSRELLPPTTSSSILAKMGSWYNRVPIWLPTLGEASELT